MNLGLALFPVVAVLFAVTAGLSVAAQRQPSVFPLALLWVLLGLLVIAAAGSILAKHRLSKTYDPNQENAAVRIAAGKARALRKEDFLKREKVDNPY
jgi:hypothetical protein